MKRFLTMIALTALVMLGACAGSRPPHAGESELALCPDTPNCVSSRAKDDQHHMEPIRFEGTPDTAMERLIRVVQSMKRTKIIRQDSLYLYVEYRTALWRFVDDVEFVIEPKLQTIHFRSASRIGKSDLGVNRKRMKEVKRRFQDYTAGT